MSLDFLDYKALEHLMQQGRITWSDLAGILQLSAPAAADRVRRLEERGVIQGYAALLSAPAIGMDLLAYVAVTLERPEHRAAFLDMVQTTPEIQECHHMAGEDDYWLKVRCQNTRHLEQIISEQIKQVRGVLRTRTTIALSTVKETPRIPLPPPEF